MSDYTASLPLELLGKIVTAAGSPTFTSWTDILRLRYHVALVNRHWREALVAELGVWKFLSIKRCTPREFVKQCAKNIGGGTLTLDIDSTPWNFAPQLEGTSQLRAVRIPSMSDFIADTLAPLIHSTPNLIDLKISAKVPRDIMNIAGTIAHMPMGELRRVKLSSNLEPNHDAGTVAGIDLPSAINFTSMDLKGISNIPFRPVQYAALTGLRLAYLDLHWKVLRGVLQLCSDRLERLHLLDVTVTRCEEGDGLVLDCLTTFALRYETDFNTAVFALLSMPRLASLRVEVMPHASLLSGYHANVNAFRRAEHITISVRAADTEALCSILHCFTSARELDFGCCSPEVAQGVLGAASAQLHLPLLRKIHIPDDIQLEDMRVLFDDHFSPGLTVVTLYDDDGMVHCTEWTQDGDQLREKGCGVLEESFDYCVVDLDW